MWFMDSGCSRHMTGVVKWFSNLTHMLFVCLILVGFWFVVFLRSEMYFRLISHLLSLP
jgi:uncharacterized membrane protein YiaA